MPSIFKHLKKSAAWKAVLLFASLLISLGLIINGTLVYLSSSGKSVDNTQTVAKESDNITDGKIEVHTRSSPVWGEGDAPVTIVEFSDFECPYCKKAYHEILPQLKRDYIDSGKLKFVYRNVPLETHSTARLKAVSALCAKELRDDDAFYTFHNLIYENTENPMPVSDLMKEIAKSINLDAEDFKTCVNENKNIADMIDLDIADGYQVGGNGTPTWFIGKTDKNGDIIKAVRVVGAQPYSVFKILIDQNLL